MTPTRTPKRQGAGAHGAHDRPGYLAGAAGALVDGAVGDSDFSQPTSASETATARSANSFIVIVFLVSVYAGSAWSELSVCSANLLNTTPGLPRINLGTIRTPARADALRQNTAPNRSARKEHTA